MRQVRVQGCLPTLVVLVVLVALGAVAVTAGLAVVAGTAALLLLLTAARLVRRLLGREPAPPERPVVEVVPPGWMSHEGGPVVDAAPREPAPGPQEGGQVGAGERRLPPGE
jgi:hypothetical protein